MPALVLACTLLLASVLLATVAGITSGDETCGTLVAQEHSGGFSSCGDAVTVRFWIVLGTAAVGVVLLLLADAWRPRSRS